MRYRDFEKIYSKDRLERYLQAVGGDKRMARLLYRENLRVSREMFTLVCCFEVALRNAIDTQLKKNYGADWLRDSIADGGFLDSSKTCETRDKVAKTYRRLNRANSYSHSQLLASMTFGTWKFLFSKHAYRATGKTLLEIFPNKPKSSKTEQINNMYLFNELDKVNNLRNRIAHHEPICLTHKSVCADTSYIRGEYEKMLILFEWMGIDASSLLWGVNHVLAICDGIDETFNKKRYPEV